MRTWHFTATVDGDDLIGEGGIATTFDDEVTASGISAKTPGYLGCSLPTGTCAKTAGSPFPHFPYRPAIYVRVWNPATNKTVTCKLIDEGPSYFAKAGTNEYGHAMIDLTPTAKLVLGAKHVNDNFPVRIRIFGGAKYMRR